MLFLGMAIKCVRLCECVTMIMTIYAFVDFDEMLHITCKISVGFANGQIRFNRFIMAIILDIERKTFLNG